jgi:UDP-N-acetylglucosamine 4,6-dehydratase
MTRFWITLSDAADFVLEALKKLYVATKEPTLSNKFFIPEMPAFAVKDLAQIMGGEGYPIKTIGIRPGEKLHESIITNEEQVAMQWLQPSSDLAKRMNKEELWEQVKCVLTP